MVTQRRLKNLLIYPQFQLKFIAIICSISLIAPVLIYFFQYLAFQDQIKNGQMMNLAEGHPYFVFYYDFIKRAFTVLLITLGVSFFASFVIGIFVSHRIAGPLIKMRKHFEGIAKGDFEEHAIYFRDKDYFKELAEAYNLKFDSKNKK
jgi:sensor histidine kinase YesM